jgi:hypothetical protein
MRTYSAKRLGTMLMKLGLKTPHDMRDMSWVFKLAKSLEKKKALRGMKDVEQEIEKRRQAIKRSRSL